MNDPQTPPDLPPDIDYQPPSQPAGLSTGAKWGLGCSIGCLLTLLIAGTIIYFVYVKVKDFGNAVLDQFTAEAPIVFQQPEADPAVIEALTARFDAFGEALKTGAETEPLSLTGEEINLLIHNHPTWKDLAGKADVAITDDQLTARLSIPLDQVGSLVKGRYLNARASIRLSLAAGHLEGYLTDIEVANQPIPEPFRQELEKQNIFEGSRSDPNLKVELERIAEIRIEGGRLILVPKPAAERQPPAATPAPVPAPAAPAEAPPPTI